VPKNDFSLRLVRKVIEKELGQALQWRNHFDIRGFKFSQTKITFDERRLWFDCIS
jgi:hypothetical protein